MWINCEVGHLVLHWHFPLLLRFFYFSFSSMSISFFRWSHFWSWNIILLNLLLCSLLEQIIAHLPKHRKLWVLMISVKFQMVSMVYIYTYIFWYKCISNSRYLLKFLVLLFTLFLSRYRRKDASSLGFVGCK